MVITGDVAAGGSGIIASTSASNISINTATSLSGALNFAGSSNMVNNLTIAVGNSNHAQIGGILTVSGMLMLTSGSLNIASSGSLVITGDISASGNGTIAAAPTSNIAVNTAVSPSGILSLAGGSNVLNNLTINIANGGTLSIGSDVVISGVLALNKGNFNIGAHTIQIASTGSISGGSSTAYVITGLGGSLSMSLTAGATTATTFPIGTATSYFPASATMNTGSASGTINMNVTPHVYGQGTTGTLISTTQDVVDATWDVKSSVSSNLNLNLAFMWSTAAEINSFNRTKSYISHYTNGAWDLGTPTSALTISAGMYGLTRANLTSLSPFAVFDQGTNAGIEETNTLNIKEKFGIYPNPSTDLINITTTSDINNTTYVDIINIDGKLMDTYKLDGSTTTITISALKAGTYFIRLYDNKSSVMKPFVKI
jgi:hypothetical protein